MLKFVNYDVVFQEIPDEVTLAINISNCPNHCQGCHSSYLMQDVGVVMTEDELTSILSTYRHDITCLAFMGGDNDPNSVMYFADWVHRTYNREIKTAWYSGKTDFPEGFNPSFFDYVKVGPYIQGFGPLKSKTTNQRLYKVLPDGLLEDITFRFWKD